jgi:hypothetical protein
MRDALFNIEIYKKSQKNNAGVNWWT